MSAGWEQTITVPSIADSVTIMFWYRHFMDGSYETDEDSWVYLSVDGTFHGRLGYDYVSFVDGPYGSDYYSNWLRFSTTIPLSPGDHVFQIGIYNNQKTETSEWCFLLVDDLRITCNHAIYMFENTGAQTNITAASLVPENENWEVYTQHTTAVFNVSHLGVAADDDIEISALTFTFDDGGGTPLSTDSAQALFENVSVYEDDGDLVFDPSDQLVGNLQPSNGYNCSYWNLAFFSFCFD